MAKDQVDLGIQVGGKSAEGFADIDNKEMLNLVQQRAPDAVREIESLIDRVEAIQRDIIRDPDMVAEYFQLASTQAKADDLLNCDLRGMTESEQTARINQIHKYTAVGSAILYQHANFRGSSKFFSITWPNFKWWPYKFNDKASSAKAWGVNVIFQHSWYRGRRLWLIGAPYFEAKNFKDFGFNDIASSFASLG